MVASLVASVVAAQGSRAQAPELWRMGLLASWPMGSSRTND